VIEDVRRTHPALPIILYISGSGGLLERMAAANPDIISIDQSVDIVDGIKRVGTGFAIQVGAPPAEPGAALHGEGLGRRRGAAGGAQTRDKQARNVAVARARAACPARCLPRALPAPRLTCRAHAPRAAAGKMLDHRRNPKPLSDEQSTQTSPRAQGNMDPGVLFGSKDVIEARVMDTIRRAKAQGVRHIMNLGHGVLPGTPEENVAHFFEVARTAHQRM
jgi:uroporphyrinogen-III decarboxylase